MIGEQRPGDWLVICEASGFKVWASETVLQWDGARVHRRFVDKRNPQDLLKGRKDNQTVPFSRPEPTDTFLSATVTPDDL